jgi:hypothetical protein
LTVWIHKTFASVSSQSDATSQGIPTMNISSIAASTPVTPLAASTSQTPAPNVQADGDANDAGAAQPPVQAALPPGQGTRIDQIA